MLTRDQTTLRPYQDADLDVLTALRNDAALQATLLALPRGSSREQVRAWLSGLAGDRGALFFVIGHAASGRALGFIQLTHLDFVHGHGELGVALAEAARGQGHGAAAIRLLEEHALDVFGLRKIVLWVLASNEAASRLYARLGYDCAGTLRAHFYHRGRHHDVHVMERLLGPITNAAPTASRRTLTPGANPPAGGSVR